MKILPDSVRCHVERSVSGMLDVIPDAAYRVAPKSMNRRKMPLLILGIPVGAGVATFNEPAFMFLLVPLWLWGAWRLGECAHCAGSGNGKFDEEDAGSERKEEAV